LLATHPFEYYGLRANQIRVGESLTSTAFVTETLKPSIWDASETRAELSAWLGSWADSPDGGTEGLLDPATEADWQHLFERINALLDVGMRKEALTEANALRQAAWDDPLALGRVALFLHEQGLHVQAARSAIQLAKLWPDGGMYDAPLVLQRVAFPLAYADLISKEALARNLDPLLLAAIIRQESLFEPSAVSAVGARGLGQVMPATGNWISGRLGRREFALDDLFRPSISIEFGAYYLDWTLGVFDEHILVSLAAYNGGPGNTRRWLEAADHDLDLFVETISLEESRRYLRKVYEGYAVYQRLYRAGGAVP
jgi:soluble lytic murein transglycosylase